MDKKTLLSPIMDAIIAEFKKKYGDNYFIGDYEDVDENTELPAILIDLNNFEGIENSIPGTFRANCNFIAFVCESFKGEAKTRVRDTSLDVAFFVDGNFWGDINTFTKAKFTIAEQEPFNEKIESAEIWRVEWQQEIYIQK